MPCGAGHACGIGRDNSHFDSPEAVTILIQYRMALYPPRPPIGILITARDGYACLKSPDAGAVGARRGPIVSHVVADVTNGLFCSDPCLYSASGTSRRWLALHVLMLG